MIHNYSYDYKKHTKRFLDFIIASILIIITSPIIILIAILIKLDSRGSVIFVQKRTGFKGKEFNIYKFRTMSRNNDVLEFNTKNQMTKVGKIIRSLSLDELPQLINIIKGEMSFIGPRPWIIEYYDNMNTFQKRRVSVLPGLTGLAQVNGRNSLSINQKINYDLVYVDKMSLIYDIKIAVDTIKAVFSRSGQEMEKSGIKHEIEILKKQSRLTYSRDVKNIVKEVISKKVYFCEKIIRLG